MKHALVVGGGSKNGRPIIDVLLEHDYHVINLGSSVYSHQNVKNIQTNWNDITVEFIHRIFHHIDHNIDFVFFNQNSSSLCSSDFSLNHDDLLEKWKLVKDWSFSLWLSCQMPFLLLHTLKDKLSQNARVGWMISSYVNYQKEGVSEHPDYSSFKFFNYLALNQFSEQNELLTFGIAPDFNRDSSDTKLKDIIADVLSNEYKKKFFKF